MISYFLGEEKTGQEMPFISSKDVKKEDFKKEDIPHKVSLTMKEYFNLPENKNKILSVKGNLGCWIFENSGTKLSFNKEINMIIESYEYLDSSLNFPGNRLYLMNNGSVIRTWVKDNGIYFCIMQHDYTFILGNDNTEWI